MQIKFTKKAQQAIEEARKSAAELGQGYVPGNCQATTLPGLLGDFIPRR